MCSLTTYINVCIICDAAMSHIFQLVVLLATKITRAKGFLVNV